MSTYVIGDVQGCLDPLLQLLKHLSFNPHQDTLWFTGDLLCRGPQPLETLQFIQKLPHTVSVLGNHDLALLAALEGIIPLASDEPSNIILTLPERKEIIHWFRHLPFLHHDTTLNAILTHAGIYPLWDLQQAIQHAHEAEDILQGKHYREFLKVMYGNTPAQWQETLRGWERIRFIVNAFTRMRFVSLDGTLDFDTKDLSHPLSYFYSWFHLPSRQSLTQTLVFGHWASLEGHCDAPNIYALDEGCVWGGSLVALCLETKQRFAVACPTRLPLL